MSPDTEADRETLLLKPTRLLRASRWNLTTRVFASTAAIVCVVVIAALLIGSSSLRQASDAAAQRGVEQSTDLVAQFLAGRERSLAGGARVFVQGPYFRTLVAERRRDDLLDQSLEAAGQLGAQWVMITDDHGELLAKSDEPRQVGDTLGGVPLIAGALTGGSTTGFGVSHDSLLFQIVAVPIVMPGSGPVGVLVATRIVDSLFGADVKAGTSADLVFYARDARGDLRVTTSTLGRDSDVVTATEALARRGPVVNGTRPTVRIHGEDYFAQAATLTTAGGEAIGGFAVLRARDAALTSIIGVRRSLVVAASLGFLLALISAYFAARRTMRPVHALSMAVRRAAGGDYHAAVTNSASVPDGDSEITALASAFDSLLADLRDKEALVSALMGANADTRDGQDSNPVAIAAGIRSISAAKSRVRSDGDIAVGEILANRYRIEAVLGSGGMGIVYRAMDYLLGEPVALKVLKPAVAADPQAFERFTQELRLARHITHRNVVRTHDLGESHGVPFITMEYVQGASLAAVIASRGALGPSAVLSIAKQLMRALAVTHEQGVIHGDLKPQNLLIGANGVLKVTDFGVARLVRGVVPEQQRRAALAAESALVARLAGAIVGTPAYMAPEQLMGEPASAASDIYAAGIVLQECLTGLTPYQSDTPAAFMARKLRETAAPAAPQLALTARSTTQTDASAILSAELEALTIEMTRIEPQNRPASATVLVERLSAMD